jgi:hypothetical protein
MKKLPTIDGRGFLRYINIQVFQYLLNQQASGWLVKYFQDKD